MLERCYKCGMVIRKDDEVVVDGRCYHTHCSFFATAERDFPIGHKLFKLIQQKLKYLEECDPRVLYRAVDRLKAINEAFGMNDSEKELS